MESEIRKIIFLDIDGVLNSTAFFEEQGVIKAPTREDYNKQMIDPIAVSILKRIIDETGAEVVLSSAWRISEENRRYIDENVVALEGYTQSCSSRIRGAEINMWLEKNVPSKVRRFKLKYAIVDDDSDMLLWQKDSFFRIDGKFGLTNEDANLIIKHLNQ
tara:strand:- start:2069 stop:2548 length:480 start_codon:yes stop_codon:yes gene_type:complete